MSNSYQYDTRPPGEGTWAVFAEKVVAERDEARAYAEQLKDRIARDNEAASRREAELEAQLEKMRGDSTL